LKFKFKLIKIRKELDSFLNNISLSHPNGLKKPVIVPRNRSPHRTSSRVVLR